MIRQAIIRSNKKQKRIFVDITRGFGVDALNGTIYSVWVCNLFKYWGMFVIGRFGHLRNLLGDENLMYAFFDETEFIHEIM